MNESCGECKFFVFKDCLENTVGELDDIGACHRYPPTIDESGGPDGDVDHPYCHSHIWVVSKNWCGEFKPCANGAPTDAPITIEKIAQFE